VYTFFNLVHYLHLRRCFVSSSNKIICRITIKTEEKIWRYLPWCSFCDKYNDSRSIIFMNP